MTLKEIQTPALCVALVAATLLVFSPVVHHDFINVDDDFYVYRNPVVAGGLTWEGVAWAFTRAHAANWHPLTWLSHMLDCQLYGLRAGGHHVTNVLLHAANAVLLFLVLRRMTKVVWPCAFVAGLFAIHPLRVESVAWVAERKDVLSGLFFMLTLCAYVRYAEARSWRRYAVVLLCFALGLMSKPMLVTLPFVLLLLDYWPLRRFQTSSRRKLVAEKIPLLAFVVASCGLTIWAQRQVGAIRTGDELAWPWRLGNAVVSGMTYIVQMVFPHELAAYYPHPADKLPLLAVTGSALALVLITAAVILWGRRFAYLPVGWFWYLGMLVPVIGLVQVGAQGHADRYTYLPQTGVYIMVAWGLAELFQRWSRLAKWALVSAVAAGLVVLSVCAWRQARYWRNSETLWTHALQCNPDSSWIEKVLGDVFYDQGRLEEAVSHYRRGAEISPNYAGLRLNFGNSLYRLSRLDEAQSHLEAAVQLDPNMADAHISLGVVLYLKGQINPAIQHFQTVLARDPANSAALSNLGIALESQGRVDEAIQCYLRALQIRPGFANARSNLARALLSQGKAAEAIPQYEQALQGNPEDLNTRSGFAEALAQTGQFERAAVELQKVLALLNPGQEAEAKKLRDRLEKYRAGRRE